jgi:glycosyltransferase involved in cell wall biosynthesis
MGLSIKEAMAANLAVIATNSGGIPEAVIPNKTGFLVELDPITKSADADKLKQYILELALNHELRTNFGSQGRERAESLFAVETTVEKVINIFTEVAKG